MYKILLVMLFVGSLSAEVVDGISIVVEGKAITLYDVKQEMKIAKVDAKRASDILIRKKLEEFEVQKREISVSSSEVYDDIKQSASRNSLTVAEFYTALRDSNGISSTELKKKVKQKLLSKKLYSAIAYKSMSQPSDEEVQEYYEIHKENFAHPSSFTVIIYQSRDRNALQEKIANPMFYSPEVSISERVLPYDRISPELASMLEKTPKHSYTTIVPDGKGGMMSFYVQDVETAEDSSAEILHDQIINMIMADKRERVLGDYFARLRINAEIKTLREVQ